MLRSRITQLCIQLRKKRTWAEILWIAIISVCALIGKMVNTLSPWQNGRHFSDDIFKLIFLNEKTPISINISLMFVPEGRINNIPALVQIMVWHRAGDKPLSEPMMVSLPTHICVTRPQWVTGSRNRIWLTPHGRHGISSHQQLKCLFNSSLRLTAKEIPKRYVTGSVVRGNHRLPVDSPHKGPVMRKVFLRCDIAMRILVQ